MLKLHLEDRVSLVKFDAAAGSIDLFLLPGAPRSSPTSCARSSTPGRRAMGRGAVEGAGERPRGDVRREREAAELEALKAHPAVKAVLDQFPDAKIAEVRELSLPPRDETGTG